MCKTGDGFRCLSTIHLKCEDHTPVCCWELEIGGKGGKTLQLRSSLNCERAHWHWMYSNRLCFHLYHGCNGRWVCLWSCTDRIHWIQKQKWESEKQICLWPRKDKLSDSFSSPVPSQVWSYQMDSRSTSPHLPMVAKSRWTTWPRWSIWSRNSRRWPGNCRWWPGSSGLKDHLKRMGWKRARTGTVFGSARIDWCSLLAQVNHHRW